MTDVPFSQLGLCEELLQAIRDLGFESPSPIQALSIPPILEGKDITGTPPDKVVTKGISYVPQTNNVFVNLSVQENLEMGAWTRTSGIPERLEEMYALFPDLRDKRRQAAGALSGGGGVAIRSDSSDMTLKLSAWSYVAAEALIEPNRRASWPTFSP